MQCAGAAQHLAGTRAADGQVHDVPPTRSGFGWHQGSAVTKDTPDGTLIARGWNKDGTYPNKGQLTQAERDAGAVLNHAAIKVGFDTNANKVIVLDQHASKDGSLQQNSYKVNEGNWSVVNSGLPYNKQPSDSEIQKPLILQGRSQ